MIAEWRRQNGNNSFSTKEMQIMMLQKQDKMSEKIDINQRDIQLKFDSFAKQPEKCASKFVTWSTFWKVIWVVGIVVGITITVIT